MKRDYEKIQIKNEKVLSDINKILKEVSIKNINEKDLDLINRIFDTIGKCYTERINYYLNSYRIDRLTDEEKSYDWSEARNSQELPEPRISDCIKGIRRNIPIEMDDYINFFPSEDKGKCRPQCVVLSTGDWEFGDTKFRNDILSYWYRCFYTNRFTLVFTESWQSSSWQKWKQLVDAYVAQQHFEIGGRIENVDHNVVIIEYSEDGVQLRYCERSI
jgi:hypothetical protein